MKKYLEYCREEGISDEKGIRPAVEYFLVYGREEKGLQLQKIPSVELVEDLCNGQFFDWQDHSGIIDARLESLKESYRWTANICSV